MTLEELEESIRILQATEEIRKLHARYAYLMDERRWDEALDLFAEDAVGDWGGTRGKFVGKKGISEFMEGARKRSVMLRHMMIQPEIEVSGDKAHAKVYIFGVGTYHLPGGETATWLHGKYNNDLVKENGKWLFKHLKFELTFQTPYHDGWVKTPVTTFVEREE